MTAAVVDPKATGTIGSRFFLDLCTMHPDLEIVLPLVFCWLLPPCTFDSNK